MQRYPAPEVAACFEGNASRIITYKAYIAFDVLSLCLPHSASSRVVPQATCNAAA